MFEFISYGSKDIVLSTIATVIASILAIVFSISLLAMQHASEKYTPRIMDYFSRNKKNKCISVLFSVTIIISIAGMIFNSEFVFGLSVVLFVLSLFALYYYFRRVSYYLNPYNLLDMLYKHAIDIQYNKNYDNFGNLSKTGENFKEILKDISWIALKSERPIAFKAINTLERIGKDISDDMDRQVVLREIGLLGIEFSKKHKSGLAVECMLKLLNLSRTYIKLVINKNKGNLYLISISLEYSKEIFYNLMKYKNLNQNQISSMFYSLQRLIKEILGYNPSELEAKRVYVMDLLRFMNKIYLITFDNNILRDTHYFTSTYCISLRYIKKDIDDKKINLKEFSKLLNKLIKEANC